MAHSIDKMKAKIAALLAKAERTDNDHERDAYTSQAERLMLKLGVERAELEAAGEIREEEIVEESRKFTGNYAIVMVPFMSTIGRSFGHLTFLQSKNYNGMERWSYVIGYKSDVADFLDLVDSLHNQVMAALKRWQRENREGRRWLTDMEKYTQNRSFIEAFGHTVARRLREERKEEVAQASAGAALVLVSKQEKVLAKKDEMYGDTLRPSRTGARTYDGSAALAGRDAGLRANLGRGIPGSSSTALEA